MGQGADPLFLPHTLWLLSHMPLHLAHFSTLPNVFSDRSGKCSTKERLFQLEIESDLTPQCTTEWKDPFLRKKISRELNSLQWQPWHSWFLSKLLHDLCLNLFSKCWIVSFKWYCSPTEQRVQYVCVREMWLAYRLYFVQCRCTVQRLSVNKWNLASGFKIETGPAYQLFTSY